MAADGLSESSTRSGLFQVDECRRTLLACDAITDTDWETAASSAHSPDSPKEILEIIGEMFSPVHFTKSAPSLTFLPGPSRVRRLTLPLFSAVTVQRYLHWAPATQG